MFQTTKQHYSLISSATGCLAKQLCFSASEAVTWPNAQMTAVSQVTKEYHELLCDDRKDLHDANHGDLHDIT